MRHIILILVLVAGAVFAGIYTWKDMHHSTYDIIEVKNFNYAVERLEELGSKIADSGMLFGSEKAFLRTNNNLTKVEYPDQLIGSSSAVSGAWILSEKDKKDCFGRIYWNDSYYYVTEFQNVGLPNSGNHLAPDGTYTKYVHIWNNHWVVAIAIFAECAAIFILWLIIENMFFKPI